MVRWIKVSDTIGGGDIHVLRTLIETLARTDLGARDKLQAVYQMSLAHRMSAVGGAIVPFLEEVVANGPFTGMSYATTAAEGCIIPKLVGCYEAELHDDLRIVAASNYETILNIGSAEGYYAVGFARAIPMATVFAWDVDETARQRTLENAERNGVSGRMVVSDKVVPTHFAQFEGQRVFVLCDIEGAEFELLNPEIAPALRTFDMIVELHPGSDRDIDLFINRFETSHDTELRWPTARDPNEYEVLARLPLFDRVLALTERLEATPWAVLKSKFNR